MSKWLKLILFVVCLSALIHLVLLFRNTDGFAAGFWPNFYSDLIVGVAIAYFITWYIGRAQTVDLRVIGHLVDIAGMKQITFIVRNAGTVAFEARQVYFHIILPQAFGPVVLEPDLVPVAKSRDGVIVLVIKGLLDGPLYPQRNAELYTLGLKSEGLAGLLKKDWGVRYALSTPKGVFPASAQVDGAFGVSWGNLGQVEYFDDERWRAKGSEASRSAS